LPIHGTASETGLEGLPNVRAGEDGWPGPRGSNYPYMKRLGSTLPVVPGRLLCANGFSRKVTRSLIAVESDCPKRLLEADFR